MPPALPTEILYGVITALGAAVLVLCGLWIKSHDGHRQWAVERINSHDKTLAVLERDYIGIREDLAEIKMMLGEHTKHDRKIHDALIAKLGLQIEGD